MEKNEWEVVHERDNKYKQPTQWRLKKSNYVIWIDETKTGYLVLDNWNGFVKERKKCRSLASAKRWVARNYL